MVVLSAVGALAYFGVLSPENLLPKDTKISNACEIKCEEINATYKGTYEEMDNGSFECKCQAPLIVHLNITTEG